MSQSASLSTSSAFLMIFKKSIKTTSAISSVSTTKSQDIAHLHVFLQDCQSQIDSLTLKLRDTKRTSRSSQSARMWKRRSRSIRDERRNWWEERRRRSESSSDLTEKLTREENERENWEKDWRRRRRREELNREMTDWERRREELKRERTDWERQREELKKKRTDWEKKRKMLMMTHHSSYHDHIDSSSFCSFLHSRISVSSHSSRMYARSCRSINEYQRKYLSMNFVRARDSWKVECETELKSRKKLTLWTTTVLRVIDRFDNAMIDELENDKKKNRESSVVVKKAKENISEFQWRSCEDSS